MKKLIAFLSPRLYPPVAVVFFIAFLLFWALRVAVRFAGWGADVEALCDALSYLCLAAAAVINGGTAKFRSAQRQWAGRAPEPAALAYAFGAVLLVGGTLYLALSGESPAEDAPSSSYSLPVSLMVGAGLVLLVFGAYWQGFVLHLFTPERAELLPSPVTAPPALRALAWLAPLPVALSLCLMAAGVETSLTRELALLIGAALFASAYIADAITINRLPAAPAHSSGAAGRSDASGQRHLTRRGGAGALFWLGLLLYATGRYLVQLSPLTERGSVFACCLLFTPLVMSGLAGLVLLFAPHPAAPDVRPTTRLRQ